MFNLVMDYRTKDIQRTSPWKILYANDLLLISEKVTKLQEDLNKWQDSNGLRINQAKTEHFACNFFYLIVDQSTNFTIDNTTILNVYNFKYLGFMITSNGSRDADVSYKTCLYCANASDCECCEFAIAQYNL